MTWNFDCVCARVAIHKMCTELKAVVKFQRSRARLSLMKRMRSVKNGSETSGRGSLTSCTKCLSSAYLYKQLCPNVFVCERVYNQRGVKKARLCKSSCGRACVCVQSKPLGVQEKVAPKKRSLSRSRWVMYVKKKEMKCKRKWRSQSSDKRKRRSVETSARESEAAWLGKTCTARSFLLSQLTLSHFL